MLEKLGIDDVCGRITLEFIHVCSCRAFGGSLGGTINEVIPCSGRESILTREASAGAHRLFRFQGGHLEGGSGEAIIILLFPPFIYGYIWRGEALIRKSEGSSVGD